MRILLLMLFLTGCSTTVIPEYTQLPTTTPPSAPAMGLRPVKVGVILDKETVYITLTTKEYENLSHNLYEMRKYTLQQKETIKYYEDLHKVK